MESSSRDFGQAIQITALDDLFSLKTALLTDGKLNRSHRSISEHILEILRESPECAKTLLDWKFVENELLYILRSSSFETGISIATLILSATQTVPPIFLSKPFLFFLSNSLSHSEEFLSSTAAAHNTDNSRISKRESAPQPARSELILEFATELVSCNREAVRALYNTGFFILAAALITPNCARFYGRVFRNVQFNYSTQNSQKQILNGSHYGMVSRPDALSSSSVVVPLSPLTNLPGRETVYEVRRKYFDSEVIFLEKNIFELKTLPKKYSSNVYYQIYNECTNMRHLIEIDPLSMLDMMLYKRMLYMNDTIELLVADKNPKALSYYRRALEAGLFPDDALVTPLLQMLDAKETALDAALALYYYRNNNLRTRNITESRIRSIFQCLEYRCTEDCVKMARKEQEQGQRAVEKEDGHIPCSFTDSQLGDDYGELSSETACTMISDATYDIPADTKVRKDSITRDQADPLDISRELDQFCNRARIISLVKSLYCSQQLPQAYFFFPSYLILMRSAMVHCNTEVDFIADYFSDFLQYVMSAGINVAKVLFPTIKHKQAVKEKFVEFKLDDEEVAGEDERKDDVGDHVMAEEEIKELLEGLRGSTVNKRMQIESDGEE